MFVITVRLYVIVYMVKILINVSSAVALPDDVKVIPIPSRCNQDCYYRGKVYAAGQRRYDLKAGGWFTCSGGFWKGPFSLFCKTKGCCYYAYDSGNTVGVPPGGSYLMHCNKCTCGKSGIAACTKIGCLNNKCYYKNHDGITGYAKPSSNFYHCPG